jgi:hypothetical protein
LIEAMHLSIVALVKSAIQQNFISILQRQKVARACNFARRTAKLDFHTFGNLK